jgi:hypothetical protein
VRVNPDSGYPIPYRRDIENENAPAVRADHQLARPRMNDEIIDGHGRQRIA